MRNAPYCDDYEALLDKMETINEVMLPPLPRAEVEKTARSVWDYERSGRNLVGSGRFLLVRHSIQDLLCDDPIAFTVFLWLMRLHGGHGVFTLANESRDKLPAKLTRKRFAAARSKFEELGLIKMIRPPSSGGGPAQYVWGKGGRN
jgi:hypothetical protein